MFSLKVQPTIKSQAQTSTCVHAVTVESGNIARPLTLCIAPVNELYAYAPVLCIQTVGLRCLPLRLCNIQANKRSSCVIFSVFIVYLLVFIAYIFITKTPKKENAYTYYMYLSVGWNCDGLTFPFAVVIRQLGRQF